MKLGKRPSPGRFRSKSPLAPRRSANRLRMIAVLAVVTLFFPAFSSGSDLYLRLSSGLGWLKAEELNLGLTSWREGWRLQAGADPGLNLENEAISSFHLGVDFEAEFLFSFSRWLALGASAGYAYASLDEENTRLSILQDGTRYDQARPTKVTAYPVYLSVYLSIPLSAKISAYLRGGVGTVFARYVVREGNKKAEASRFSYTSYDNATARRGCYRGSLGLSYAVDPSLGFFVEAAAHRAKISGFEAVDELGIRSRLYTYEEYRPDMDFWQLRTGLRPEEPGGTGVRNVREATVDFSGYSAKMGIFLKF